MIRSLKSKAKIKAVFEKGSTIKSSPFLLKTYRFKDGEVKFGVSVSKNLFPSAVKRNLIKRRLREQILSSGFLKKISKGTSFFVVYNSTSLLSSKEIRAALIKLAKKI